MLARCRIIAKRIRLFPNLTDLSGRGKSVELEQTTKQTNNKKEHVIHVIAVRHARGSQE